MSVARQAFWPGIICCLGFGTVLADDAISLRYKPTRGERLVYRCQTDVGQVQTIKDTKIDQELSQQQLCTRTVDEIDAEGNARVSLKTERFKLSAKFGPAGDYEFNSQSDQRDRKSKIGAAITPIFERLVGSKIRAVVTPHGEVREVTGYEELLHDLLVNNPIGLQFTGGGSNEAARMGLQDQFIVLSRNALKPGESWEVPWDTELPRLGKTRGKRIYKYVGPDKVGSLATAKIDATFELSYDVDIDMPEAKITGSVAVIKSSSVVQFDVAAGRLISSQASFSLRGELSVEANGEKTPIQIEQTQKITFELLDNLPQ